MRRYLTANSYHVFQLFSVGGIVGCHAQAKG